MLFEGSNTGALVAGYLMERQRLRFLRILLDNPRLSLDDCVSPQHIFLVTVCAQRRTQPRAKIIPRF